MASNLSTKSFTKSKKIDLGGIIIAVPTPFQEDEQQSVDYNKLKENIAKWETIPLTGKIIIYFSRIVTYVYLYLD